MLLQEKSSQQRNFYDCGVYVVLNAEVMCTFMATELRTLATTATSTAQPAVTGPVKSPASRKRKPAAVTPGDISAYRALALACLTRMWLDGMDIPTSDERWEAHDLALASLPECLRETNLR